MPRSLIEAVLELPGLISVLSSFLDDLTVAAECTRLTRRVHTLLPPPRVRALVGRALHHEGLHERHVRDLERILLVQPASPASSASAESTTAVSPEHSNSSSSSSSLNSSSVSVLQPQQPPSWDRISRLETLTIADRDASGQRYEELAKGLTRFAPNLSNPFIWFHRAFELIEPIWFKIIQYFSIQIVHQYLAALQIAPFARHH